MPQSKPGKTPTRWIAGVGVFLAICLAVLLATARQPSDAPPWYAIVPPLLAVTMAMVTNRIFLSLGAAVVAGGLLSVWPISVALESLGGFGLVFQGVGGAFLYDGIADVDSLQILLFVVLIMCMIAVMLVGGGLQGVADQLGRYARSPRSAQWTTFAAGLVIFIDDYANTMIVGSAMRPMTDRQRISREKLAFLVDATAAPVAGIAVVSTWIGVEVGLLSDISAKLNLGQDGYAMFFDALGYRLYCIGMIAFVFFNAISDTDFGPMAKAQRRARKHGKLLEDGARPVASESLAAAGPHPRARVSASVAIVPMVTLLAVFVARLWSDGGGLARPAGDLLRFSVWREVLSSVNSIPVLAHAAAVGLLLSILLAKFAARVPLSALVRAIWIGGKSSLMPVTVLTLAWSLQAACAELRTGELLVGILGDTLPPAVFPALAFVVAAMVSFATGTSFGTMAILIPTAIPVAFALDGGTYGLVTIMSVAAVLDGSIFGDHCSPISDTTIMSSTASACDHLAHVRTQIPYSLVVAAVALCTGYLPAGMGMPQWVAILLGVASPALLFAGLSALKR